MGRGVLRVGASRAGCHRVGRGWPRLSQNKRDSFDARPHSLLALPSHTACLPSHMASSNETDISSIIYAVTLCDLINRKKDHGIMQATCNNHCARLPPDRFV